MTQYAKDAIDIAKIYPIQSVESNGLVNGNGDITIGFSLMLPEMYTVTYEQANALHESFVSFFSLLPVGTVIHKQDFFYVDKYRPLVNSNRSFTRIANLRYFNERPVLRNYSNIFFTYVRDPSIEIGSTNNSFSSLKDYVFKKPFGSVDDLIREVKNFEITVCNGMSGLPLMESIRLDDDALMVALYDTWNLKYGETKTYANIENALFSPMETDKSRLKIGNEYVSIVSLIEEGLDVDFARISKINSSEVYNTNIQLSNTIKVPTSFTFPIGLGLPVNHILNTAIVVQDKEKIIKYLKDKRGSMTLPATFGFGNEKIRLIDSYLGSIENAKYTPSTTCVNVVLHHEDLDVLKSYESLVKTAYSNMNRGKAYVESYDAANLFVSCTPGNFKSNYRTHLIVNTIDQAVCYVHYEGAYRSDRNGNLFVDRQGAPVMLDMWQSKAIDNRNKIVIGPSGKGKSFLINGLIEDSLYNGNHVCVVDIGHSYKRICELNHGRYYDSSNIKEFYFNIFICPKDSKGRYMYSVMDEDGEGGSDRIDFILSVLLQIWMPNQFVKMDIKTILKDCISNYYEHVNKLGLFPDLVGFYNYLNVYTETVFDKKRLVYIDFESLRLNLEPYVNGSYKYLFNSQENIDLIDYKLVVFDLEAIKDNKDLFNIISLIVAELVLDKTKRLPTVRKTFIIDEALDFLKGDIKEFIAYLYRTFRKKEGEVYFAAQNIAFLDSTSVEVKESLLANSDTRIILSHKGYERFYDAMKSTLSLSNDDIDLIDSIEMSPESGDLTGYREFFMKMGSVSKVFRNEVSRETAAVYTTRKTEVAEIERLYKEYKYMPSAINAYVREKYQKLANQ